MALATKSSFQLSALALALASIGAPAATISWGSDTSGSWTLPINWNPVGLPGAGDDVTITNVTGLKTITHGAGNDTIQSLTTNASAIVLVNGGSTLAINNGASTNGGVLRADGNGSTITYNNGSLLNHGTLDATNNGVVALNNIGVSGGTLSTSSGGTIRLGSGTFLNGSGIGAPIITAGNLVVNDSATTYIAGIVHNSGDLKVGTNADLRVQGTNNLMLDGTGTVTLAAGNSRIFGDNGNDVLTNAAGHTIQGQGQLGVGSLKFVNQGSVTANVSGATLTVQPLGGQDSFVNGGSLRAENGGVLVLNGGTFTNNAGTVDVLAGSTVHLNASTLQGGVVNAGGNGLSMTGGSFLDGATHGATTVNGNVIDADNQTSYIAGTIHNNGTITVASNADLRVQSTNNLTLDGAGNITLVAGNSRIYGDNGNDVLTNTAGHTIQGQGQLGAGSLTMINQGLIAANVAGATLTVQPLGGQDRFINTGTMRAENGGSLTLNGGTFTNAGGTVASLAGSMVNLNASTLQGGIVNAGGSGLVMTSGSFFDGATHGAITLNGNVIDGDNQTSYIAGTINNNGAIAVNTNADLRLQGTNNLTLNGAGNVTLLAGNARIFGDNGNDILINTAGHTIQGQGQLGIGSLTVQNQGLITSNVAGGTLTVQPLAGPDGLINTGTMRADGGALVLQNGTFNNGGGTIQARGSAVTVSGATLQGGLLTSTAGGTFVITNGSVLDGASNGTIHHAATMQIADNQTIYALGTIDNTGVITVGTNTDLRLQALNNLALTGNGTLTLHAGNTRIFGDNGNDVLTNGAGHTINGQGQIGIGSLQVTNAGTIAADVSGTSMLLNTLGPVMNQSTGVLRASNGGTLAIDKAVNGSGTIQSDTGGTVTLNAASTTGRLVNNANLTLGANSITVSTDYGNANFGTGNGFNKHANVSGTGQILASGDVAQAITGTNVTNGASGTPTLTIGNVRVGGTTYDYQVANTGTNGPAIRGALQTGVNGGNVTDARLSGSGVTASNYGPVIAGSNSGHLGVTFTVASAGTLAPLAGQSVHVANNFDNVAEQTLNIVLGSGAAAYNAAIGATTPSPVTVTNQRVGGTNSSALTVANTAAAGNFSEALNAGFSGTTGSATSNGGSFTNLAAGSSNTGTLAVGVNTATSGARSGTVTIGYQTDGTGSNGHSGLTAIAAGSQTIGVSGNVYQAAAGNIVTAPLNFGTVQVGQNVNQVITVRNTATGAAGFVEDLNASFGAATGTGAGRLAGSGSVAGLVAGASSNGLSVGVNTSTAGTVNASIAVNYFSAGSVGGVSNGLGILAVGSQGYGVSGTIASTANVVDQAAPVINNSPIALGNVRIGSASPTGLVSVTNQATGNQQAALDASISGNGGITASGSFNLLAPGATNNTGLAVGLDTSVAGNRSGNATIAFVSDASNIGGCGTACQMSIGSQSVAVTGAVYRLANPSATPSTVTVAGRVGSVAPTTALTITNASPDIYTEGLSVSRGATSAGFTSTGGITNLAAGGTSHAIGVTLNTTTAGTFSGTQALNYVSTGAGTTGAADLAIGSGAVTLDGRVYTTAAATNNTPAVNFGIVHVGDTASHSVSVTNSAPVTALNDTLVASAAGATGPFTASGNVTGLTAGSTGSALSVGLNTATAGVFTGSAAFSAASHDADLSDAALANLAVSLSGQVNNYATDAFAFDHGAGSFTRVGSTYVLDYGTVAQDSGVRSTTLTAANTAAGPADELAGSFQFLDPADFGESGFASFLALAAGQSTGPLTLAFDSTTIGSFVDTIVLHGVGSNASGYAGAIGDIQLVVRGIVAGAGTPPGNDVPEPDSLILLGLGLPLLFLRRGRKSATSKP